MRELVKKTRESIEGFLMAVVYFLIAIIATTIGAGAGIGGGVIIKPALDALGGYNAFVIGNLSSITILSMAIVSTVKCFLKGVKIDKRLVALTIGAIVGGFLGKELFSLVDGTIEESVIKTIQAAMMIALLLIALFKNKLPCFHIKNIVAVIFTGLVLGTLSAFLGIGGGPINVAVLCMFFAMDIKKAAAGSIFIILFSQITKLATITLTTGFGAHDYSMLYFMIPGGILGGFLGSWVNSKFEEKHIEKLFFVVVGAMILLNIYNIITFNI